MLKKREFEVLGYIAQSKDKISQRSISKAVGVSLGTANSLVTSLSERGLITEKYEITESGCEALKPYKVKNAVILAAGMSTRFVPVSYEIPKALLRVKGEVLIERIIRQLHEKGINDITIVIGYMMEKFLFLKEKYGVEFAINNEYRIKNTHSSLNCVKEKLSNTYIICADNYFKENVFNKYEYRAFYASVFIKEKNYERGFFTDKNGLIINTCKPSENMWVMFGHAYFDRKFSEAFLPLLSEYFGKPGVENYYWEWIFTENLDKLEMYIKKYPDGVIYEFDSIDDLKAYDPDYIKNNSIGLINNICRALDCQPEDITDIRKLPRGFSNATFVFSCKGERYCYRHPGRESDKIHHRSREAKANKSAFEIGVDDSLIYFDENSGQKISRFIDVLSDYDPSDRNHIKLLADSLRNLHDNAKTVGERFDFYDEALKLIDMINSADNSSYAYLEGLSEKAKEFYDELTKDKWDSCLCHNDIDIPNILITEKKAVLIDWEFSADGDKGFDICKLFTFLPYKKENVLNGLELYFGRPPRADEIYHVVNCAVLNYFYYTVWALYMIKNGKDYSGNMMTYYERFLTYGNVSRQIKEKGELA